MNPKIACICVLEKDSSYLENAVMCFQNQTYEHKELWVVYNGNDEKTSLLLANYENANRISLKETPNGAEEIWLLEYTLRTDSELYFVEVNALVYANKGKKRNIILALTGSDYICTWSPTAHHASDRLFKQFNFSEFLGKTSCVLANTQVYNQSDNIGGFSIPSESGIIETLFSQKEGLMFPDLDVNEELEVQKLLFEGQNICILDEPELYTKVGSFGIKYSYAGKFSAEESEALRLKIGAKKEYDGILSLGSWCQVGAAIRRMGLTQINSPIHNFGIKSWRNLLDILENRFEGYWEKENLAIGKTDVGYSAQYNDERAIYKVYCNKYNMISNHHFDEVDNTPTELKTFDSFKEKIDLLSEIFLVQCKQYERVLFGLKVMSAPEDTVIEKADILRLVNVLNELREGKPYDLRLTVPEAQYEQVKTWIEEEKLMHLSVNSWSIVWNNDVQDVEWKWMFGEAKLADDYFDRLNTQIIGLEEISYQHIHYLNS